MTEPRDVLTPWEDPIVAEVRSAREALFAAAGYNLEELSRRLREEQLAAGRTAVILPPRSANEKDGAAA